MDHGVGNVEFQSTLPVWGATTEGVFPATWARFQSTLPVWGATRLVAPFATGAGISIHAPRVGSDGSIEVDRADQRFQSTLPVWGATRCPGQRQRGGHISIHAPRVGSDLNQPAVVQTPINFNPRSPCGERP